MMDALYGKHGNHVARLDLGTWEIQDIAALASAEGSGVLAYLPDRFILFEREPGRKILSVSLIRDGRIDRVRTFSDDDSKQKKFAFAVRRNGLILSKGRARRVITFPDLKELNFK
jgi:hypothetical protein